MPQSLGFVKGQARVSTLLMLIVVLLDHRVNIAEDHPKLYETICQIYVFHCWVKSQQEALYANFRVSVRGSIRRAPSSVTWASSLIKLQVSESDANAILTTWNATASKSAQIHGHKATVVKQLLSLPPGVQALLFQHSSAFGWENSCLSDEALSSKKLYPPYTFRVISSKEWTQRGRVTTRSCELMFRAIFRRFEACPARFRQKTAKPQFEEAAEQCAVLCAFITELRSIRPVSDEAIDTSIIQPFLNNDLSLELQLSSAVRSKEKNFVVTDLPAFKGLIDSHKGMGPSAALVSSMNNLEEGAFALTMKQLKYDHESWKAAQHFLATNCRFVANGSPEHLWQEITMFQTSLARDRQIDTQSVHLVALLNMVSPCMLSAPAMDLIYKITSTCVNSAPDNVGVILSPLFVYKKGDLWNTERSVLSKLVEKNLVIDKSWSLLFSKKPDSREARPLIYKGRLIEPGVASKDSIMRRGSSWPAGTLSQQRCCHPGPWR